MYCTSLPIGMWRDSVKTVDTEIMKHHSSNFDAMTPLRIVMAAIALAATLLLHVSLTHGILTWLLEHIISGTLAGAKVINTMQGCGMPSRKTTEMDVRIMLCNGRKSHPLDLLQRPGHDFSAKINFVADHFVREILQGRSPRLPSSNPIATACHPTERQAAVKAGYAIGSPAAEFGCGLLEPFHQDAVCRPTHGRIFWPLDYRQRQNQSGWWSPENALYRLALYRLRQAPATEVASVIASELLRVRAPVEARVAALRHRLGSYGASLCLQHTNLAASKQARQTLQEEASRALREMGELLVLVVSDDKPFVETLAAANPNVTLVALRNVSREDAAHAAGCSRASSPLGWACVGPRREEAPRIRTLPPLRRSQGLVRWVVTSFESEAEEILVTARLLAAPLVLAANLATDLGMLALTTALQQGHVPRVLDLHRPSLWVTRQGYLCSGSYFCSLMVGPRSRSVCRTFSDARNPKRTSGHLRSARVFATYLDQRAFAR